MPVLENRLRGHDIMIHGFNGAVINTLDEDIADQSSAIVFPAAATLLEVASSSVADVLTSGTGGWTIRVYGLDADYKWQTEDFSLNGQNMVLGTKLFLFVFGAEVLTVGTGLVNAGVISVADDVVTWTTGTPSDLTATFAQIPIGDNISHSGVFVAPVGETYELTELLVTNSTQIVTIKINIKPFGEPAKRDTYIQMAATSPPQQIKIPKNEYIITPKAQLRIQGRAAVSGAVTSITATLKRIIVAA